MIIRFLKSLGHAANGIRASFQEQHNLKIQLAIGVLVVAAGFYLRISSTDWCIVLLTIALVIGFEMVNSAIEDLVNLVTQEWKPLAGKIKDIAAGAVLFVASCAVIVGVLVFNKYL